MVRKFYLENENGQRYSLMDIENGCLLTSPSGLGFAKDIDYEQIGDDFVENTNHISQASIQAEVNFLNYTNYKNFADFILRATALKLIYIIPSDTVATGEEYFKDVNVSELTKTEIQPNGVMTEAITIDSLSLWNKKTDIVYNISEQQNETRWDIRFPSTFVSYSSRKIVYNNEGHKAAAFLLEIPGFVINPVLTIRQNGEEINSLAIDQTFEEGETFLYCTRPSDMFIYRYTNGVYTNLFSSLDINNTNFFLLPKGASEILISADNEIQSAKLTIFQEYIGI